MSKASGLVCLLLLSLLSAPVQAVQTVCNDNGGAGFPIAITSVSTADIDFPFVDDGIIVDVDVFVDIEFPWVGDLSTTITNPDGTSVLLFHRPGLPGPPTALGPPYGCAGDDINATFDDESLNGRLEDDACGNNPAYGGPTYTVHNEPAVNPLSDFDSEQVAGTWVFTFENAERFDTGTLLNTCITVQFAGVVFDQWVSTNATCTDQVDALNAVLGDNIYVCYTLSNPGDESFSLDVGEDDWNDTLGNDLSGLEGIYAAGASQTVNFGPFVAGAAPFFQGTTVGDSDVTVHGNSANFPPAQFINTTESVTVNVTNSLPGSASKPLYLYNNDTLSRVAPTTQQNERNIGELATRTWTMAPNLEAALVLDKTNTIDLSLYMREVGTGTLRNITFTVSGSVSGAIATLTQDFNLTGASVLYNVSLAYIGAGPAALVDGETITLAITNNTSGSGNRRVRIIPSNPLGNNSTMFLPSNTIINVDSIVVYDLPFTNPAAVPISGAQANDDIYVRAQISDPFGTFDITSINNLFTDPTPTVQATDVASIVIIDDVTAAQKTYEIAYTVPPFPVLGDWRIDVTGNEGTAIENISHSDFINFLILEPPNLGVVKTAATAVPGFAAPGETVTYTITVTNSGIGFAENVTLDDDVSPQLDVDTGSFSCTAGCPGSGVTMGVPTFNFDGSGQVIDWNLIMGGTMNGGGASFSIEYEADIDN